MINLNLCMLCVSKLPSLRPLRGKNVLEWESSVTIPTQLVWIINPLRCIRQLPLCPIINHLPDEHQPRLGTDSLAGCCYLAAGEACISLL